MKLYVTQEFNNLIGTPQIPINGFKFRLVKYISGYNPASSGVAQDTIFSGYTRYTDSVVIPSDNGLKILFNLADDPNVLASSGSYYYNGALAYYYDIIENTYLIAFLLDENNTPRRLVNGINAILMSNVGLHEVYPYTDKGDGILTLSDRPTYKSGFLEDGDIHNLYKILYNDTFTSGAGSPNSYFNLIEGDIDNNVNQFNNDLIISI